MSADENWELYAKSLFKCEGCNRIKRGKWMSRCTDGKTHYICNRCVANGTHDRLHRVGKWLKK